MLTLDTAVGFDLEEGPFRYLAFRRWGPGPSVGWLLDHPRPADRHTQILSWLRAHAQRWGFGALEVAWLFSWPSYTTPIVFAYPDHRGPHTSEAIRFVVRRQPADALVLGWGDGPSREAITAALPLLPSSALMLGRTHRGNPAAPGPRIGYDAPMMRCRPHPTGDV